MDRLNQLRVDAGTSRDSTLDTSSPADAYVTANESSSKYFSLTDSSFSISPAKEAATINQDTIESDTEAIISNLSPIPKSNELDSFKIGAQIEAANILSGGVNIFEDNENSYDEDELVIDDAVQDGEDKSELKLSDNPELPFEKADRETDNVLEDSEASSPAKDTEVVLQIDGKNVDAIDIGNRLYLYRKDGEEELAAVQIFDDDQQQPNIKFLKVRENAEGNLEVYEEIEIEVPKEVPVQQGKSVKSSAHIPVKEVSKVSDPTCDKVAEKKSHVQPKDVTVCEVDSEINKDINQIESKTEVNLNGKTMKFSESRKSPLVSTFTPMTYHSTPNKEGIPLTKTMVDLQLHPSRHSENVKKTIEVHTDNCKQRLMETPTKNNKDTNEHIKCSEICPVDKEQSNDTSPSKPYQNDQEDNETDENMVIEQKFDDKISINITDATTNPMKNAPTQSDTEKLGSNVVNDNKTEISEIKTPSQLEKSNAVVEGACILTIEDIKEHNRTEKDADDKEISLDLLKEKVNIDVKSSEIISEKITPKLRTDDIGSKDVEEKLQKCAQLEDKEMKEDTISYNLNSVSKSDINDTTHSKHTKNSEDTLPQTFIKRKSIEESNADNIDMHKEEETNDIYKNLKNHKNCPIDPSESFHESKNDSSDKEMTTELNKPLGVVCLPKDKEMSTELNKLLEEVECLPKDKEMSTELNEPLEGVVCLPKDTEMSTELNKLLEEVECLPKDKEMSTELNEPLEGEECLPKDKEMSTELNKPLEGEECLPKDKEMPTELNKPLEGEECLPKDKEMSTELNEPLEGEECLPKDKEMSTELNKPLEEEECLPKDKEMSTELNKPLEGEECLPKDKEMSTELNKHLEGEECLSKDVESKTDIKVEQSKTVTDQNLEMIQNCEIKKDTEEDEAKKLNKVSENAQNLAKIGSEIEQPEVKTINKFIDNTTVENNDDILLKLPKEPVNMVQIVAQDTKTKPFSVLEAEKVSIVNLPKHVVESNSNMDINQPINEIFKPKKIMAVNKTEHDSQNNISNSCEIATKDTAGQLNEAKIVNSSILDIEHMTNSTTDFKDNSVNSLPIIKTNIIPVSNKIDSIKKESAMVAVKPRDTSHNVDSKTNLTSHNLQQDDDRSKNDVKKEVVKISKNTNIKPINNNKAAVPFGMWTEAHRQEFLNKIKESKVPTNTSNTKQLKQPNDLNRRDVLQKIDSQRQSNIASIKVQEQASINKIKNEAAAFVSKTNVPQKEKPKDKVFASNSKSEESISKSQVDNDKIMTHNDQIVDKNQNTQSVSVDKSSSGLKDLVRRKGLNTQHLIDKTVEGIINRTVSVKFNQDDSEQNTELLEKSKSTAFTPVSLDEIESKMNELHGIPFVERPPHELPKVFDSENKTVVHDVPKASVTNKIPKHTPFTNKPEQTNEKNAHQSSSANRAVDDSEEEIIEHEPITGDKEFNLKKSPAPIQDSLKPQESSPREISDSKKESIITENDFDKFARRNSITYENRLTVNFDSKEQPNVVHTVVEKEVIPKKMSRNEIMLAESKAKSNKHLAMRHNNLSSKIPTLVKTTTDEDSFSKNYQSKVQIAYQSVMTAKRQQECPITIIEDKPVKVVFMDSNPDFMPHQLNIQGKDLSPSKKSSTDWDNFMHSNSESLDSDILEVSYDAKSQDDTKFKSKHQRKQVLTPVEAPEFELIEPADLGIVVSPKKKRKVDENSKTLVPKKSYVLNRNMTTDDTSPKPRDLTKSASKDSEPQEEVFKHSGAISAIDNLVKAAELLETQSEIKHAPSDQNSPIQQNTPTKRGRGRPRKYPLPDQGSESKSPSPVKTPTPQKKPRLIDAKIPKQEIVSEDDDTSSDGELVKENWTMGKINENIVCPICNKLFRSENVVFKHVKHCTGPSPSRSDSDKRSPRRMRQSQDIDWKSEDNKSDSNDSDEMNKPIKKRKSKEKRPSITVKNEIIIIEDTPVKEPLQQCDKSKQESNETTRITNVNKNNNLVCEVCGKTFRQLSYLVHHKLQHKNVESKKIEREQVHKSLFSCEICKKEFRKLHHLVQHRIIHNPHSMSTRVSRRSSSEQGENKTVKESKLMEDQSAGFRCEPCDKSFRKLHHLVEHRETHRDRESTTSVDATKESPLYNCDVCKKTFKKLQHLIEHKEYHLETSSEKSDDKSVKSSLSTRDIIHECPLCYMVFPNEHSLTKHNIMCQRKKKQSAAKQAKKIDEADVDEEKTAGEEEVEMNTDTCVIVQDVSHSITESKEAIEKVTLKPAELEQPKEVESCKEIKPVEEDLSLLQTPIVIKEKFKTEIDEEIHEIDKPLKVKKQATLPDPVEVTKVTDLASLKKKLPTKDKIEDTLAKRKKTTNGSFSSASDTKTVDLSDDDDIRYMINPDFVDESREGKMFMKVRAMKRNSLQIEQPKSKALVKRSTSLQHPPKIPRLKVKPIPRKPINTNSTIKSTRTTSFLNPVPSTDSDDSDVKYSFPVTVKKEVEKNEKNAKRQTFVAKRKSLSNIAKKKSLGKITRPSPAKQIRKRSTQVDIRCDCGQQFSSEALLARHAVLAHTPPRVRRRRSPLPDKPIQVSKKPSTETVKSNTRKSSVSVGDPKIAESRRSTKTDPAVENAKPAKRKPSVGAAAKATETKKPGTRKSSATADAKLAESRRSTKSESVKQDTKPVTRKSSVTGDTKTESRKSVKPESPAGARIGVATRKSSVTGDVKASVTRKIRRSAPPHKGVPVPEKMRKLMEKSKK